MKLITMKMKLFEKNGKKVSTFSGSSVEWVEEESFFLSYHLGKKDY